MARHDSIQYYLEDPNAVRPPGFTYPRAPPPPTPQAYAQPHAHSHYEKRPSISSGSPTLSSGTIESSYSRGSESDILSRRSSISSATSRPPWAPILDLNAQIVMTPYEFGYNLPCECLVTGCRLQFDPGHHEAWISHSISHFGRYGPPSKAICTFCDEEFDCSQRGTTPISNWRDRLNHIGGHFQEFRTANHPRPDFFVVDYLWRHRLLSDSDYQYAIKHTERPGEQYRQNMHPLGWQTPDMEERQERSKRQVYDLDKEDRQMRREKRKGKGKETNSSRQSRH